MRGTKSAKISQSESSSEELVSELESPVVKKNKGGRPKGSKTGAKHIRILTLRQKGNTHAEIAEKVKTSEDHVWKVLKKWEERLPALAQAEGFRKVRPDILTAAQDKVLKFLTKDKLLETARLSELAKASDILYKQERLERGLSTANKSIIKHTKVLLPSEDVPPSDS